MKKKLVKRKKKYDTNKVVLYLGEGCQVGDGCGTIGGGCFVGKDCGAGVNC